MNRTFSTGVLVVCAAVLGMAPSVSAQDPTPSSAAQPPAAAPQAPAQAPQPEPRVEILQQILVKVNGEIFTKTDLEERQVDAIRRQQKQQLSDDELRKAIADITPDVLVDAVDELLLLQRGRELGYKVSDEQFKRILENIRKENKLEDDAQFEAALKQEGIELSTLRRNIERSMVINQVQQVEVFGRINVTEDEATAYYNQHQNEFSTPAQYTLRELSVAVKTDGRTMNVSADEEAKRKAESARARAQKGEAFETLVAELSDAGSKSSGGLVGPINESDLDPAIQKMLAPLKAGEVTEVFRTRGGWALLKVESATKAQVKTREEARDEISDKVFRSKQRDEVAKYLQKLRAQAIIDWKNAEMKRLWDAQIAVETKGLPKVQQ